MKLHTILNCWQVHNDAVVSPGNKVYSKIPMFARRVELMQRVEEMRKVCTMYNECEQEKIRELIQAHCDELNEVNKENEKWEKLEIGKNISNVPQGKIQELINWRVEKINEEIDVKPLKFRPEELEAADLSGDELLVMKDFYEEKELAEYVKKK